jgi:hypothetical protein
MMDKQVVIDIYLATIGKTWEEITAYQRSVLHSFADEATQAILDRLREAELSGRIDELESLYVDFDDRKLRHIDGAKLTPISERLQRLKDRSSDE